jgi:hypothetical protein
VKSRLAVGLMLGCLVAAAACSSSSSSSTAASPTQDFQVSTPNGQVTVSATGKLPPNWPSGFPVPSGTHVAGSGSVAGSTSATSIAAYTTSQSPSDAFTFYESNSKLTTSSGNSVGVGSHFLGAMKITAPYTGSVTVAFHSATTYIVVVLTSSSSTASPAAS